MPLAHFCRFLTVLEDIFRWAGNFRPLLHCTPCTVYRIFLTTFYVALVLKCSCFSCKNLLWNLFKSAINKFEFFLVLKQNKGLLRENMKRKKAKFFLWFFLTIHYSCFFWIFVTFFYIYLNKDKIPLNYINCYELLRHEANVNSAILTHLLTVHWDQFRKKCSVPLISFKPYDKKI